MRLGRTLAAITVFAFHSWSSVPLANASTAASAQASVMARVSEMKRNFEAITDFDALFSYEVDDWDHTVTRFVVRLSWAKPGLFRGEQIAMTSTKGEWVEISTPLFAAAFDGLKSYMMRQYLSEDVFIHGASGLIRDPRDEVADMGELHVMDVRQQVWGDPDRRTWDVLLDLSASGRIVSARPERQFDCDGFAIEARGEHPEYDVYHWIDDSHGFMRRIYLSQPRSSSGTRIEFRVNEVANVGGVWFPTVAVLTETCPEKVATATWRIISLKINKGMPASAFKVEFKPGTWVRDDIQNKEYVVPPE